MVKPFLIYSGIGIYSPTITPTGVVWQRNTDGDPLLGVCIENIRHVRKFAEIVRIEVPKTEKEAQA